MKSNVIYLKDLLVNDQPTVTKRLHVLAIKRYDLSQVLKPALKEDKTVEPEVYDLTDNFNGGF